MAEEDLYKIRFSGSAGTSGILVPVPSGRRTTQYLQIPQVEKEVTNRELEQLLKGLLNAFEKSSTPHYFVKRAKTSIVVTKNAEGKIGVSLGLNVFKFLDASGNIKGEKTEGVEIEIERTER